MKFKNLQKITTDRDEIVKALKSQSELVEVAEDEESVRRSPEKPVGNHDEVLDDFKRRSVFIVSWFLSFFWICITKWGYDIFLWVVYIRYLLYNMCLFGFRENFHLLQHLMTLKMNILLCMEMFQVLLCVVIVKLKVSGEVYLQHLKQKNMLVNFLPILRHKFFVVIFWIVRCNLTMKNFFY